MKKAALSTLACALIGLVVWALWRGDPPRSHAATGSADAGRTTRKLRVCADPNNLPFSNDKQEGFENRMAELIAADLGAELEYTWWAQRRGYIRNTIRAGLCDVLMGMPSEMDMLLVTKPYYRSTYVFVYRKDSGRQIRSLDAPELRKLSVGVQMVGDDYTNTPPAHALARRGIVNNVRGYSVVGNYAAPNPPARIIEAVASREVDVAVAWGPLAGYFAARQGVALDVVPVSPEADTPALPFVYDISMAVRRQDKGLKEDLDRVLERRQSQIEQILDRYNVPRLPLEGS